jgi:hypothetical protein
MDLSLLLADQINQLRLLLFAPAATSAATTNPTTTATAPSQLAPAVLHTVPDAHSAAALPQPLQLPMPTPSNQQGQTLAPHLGGQVCYYCDLLKHKRVIYSLL